MRDEHRIKQRGKDYVLFAGLVAEAHAQYATFNLTAELDTELLKISPDQPVVNAYFQGEKKGDGGRFESTGIGTGGRETDTKGAAADAPIEMAETRAKARALRIAVNVGETAAEELPSEASEADEVTWTSPIQRGQAARANPAKNKKNPASEAIVKPETLRQLRFLADTFAETRGDDTEEHWTAFIDNLGHPVEELTEGLAQKWISRYQKGLKKLEEEEGV